MENLDLIISLTQQMSLYLVLAYLLTKTPVLRPMVDLAVHLPHKLMLYMAFSLLCIMGTYFGEATHGAIANTRAIGAILSGLLGGPVVGTLVGLTGGLHRYSLGGFTDVACAISTTAEGLLAGLMHQRLVRKGNLDRLFDPRRVALTALTAETVQMLIILAVARPFDEALALVKVIALPMMLVNSLGAALFMSMIRDQRAIAEKLSSVHSAKALKIAERTVGVLVNGFNQETTAKVARIIFEETKVSAVAITDREKLLAFIGTGADHHIPGTPISSKMTLEAIATNQVVFADGVERPYRCSLSDHCQLGSSLIVPLRSENEVIGTIKLYETKKRLFLSLNQTLGEGIARLLSNQILTGRYLEQKSLLTQAELKLLHAQVNPHFLFNALNTLAAITRRSPEQARELIQHLAAFLRGNLKRGTGEITLAEELEHIQAYLTIEQARFGDRLQVSIQVPDALRHCRLPTFTLQPLVENAIKHGTSTLLEPGKIEIGARQEQETLALWVSDNAGAYEAKSSSDGLGMNIVDRRIKNEYGEQYGVQVHCEPQVRTEIEVRLPKRELA
ncbi:signal transduction histidine kinase, LytS [Ferrimonas balearica DSM 9799]|uniref:histidine kinase n=1 Tax=Ferrimonas balearica (strain DSM 9799 / CCM 4581 / KCTC 23876 / PAT) TaxID=550540 RepID=E1SRP8_FERBD|nr:sensor histidine kinase [Ferrimonas balearica]ADN76969.1 signal transduction histidine kinase, LytS [Ferrimonas balearica DSM 9799]MBY5980073.1 sensor histidine kinase [Ferrimonas balearica]MBY6093731.1 sensor histidine kinase [Ferrimonas balearica]